MVDSVSANAIGELNTINYYILHVESALSNRVGYFYKEGNGMRFNLDGTQAFIITKTEDGCSISNHIGLYMPAEQMLEVAQEIIKYANKYKKKIEQYNENKNLEYDREFKKYIQTPKKKKEQPKAHVYMLECGGRYKVGFTVDIERRVSEIDKRPFDINVIALSRELKHEIAYQKEQYIHEKIKQFRVCGEWYEISNKKIVENIIEYIARL